MAPATNNGKNFIPRVAVKLDVAPLSDVTAVVAEDTFERPTYAGNAMATVQSSDSVKVMTVRTTAFEKADVGSGSGAVADAPAPDSADAGALSPRLCCRLGVWLLRYTPGKHRRGGSACGLHVVTTPPWHESWCGRINERRRLP